MNLAHMYQEGYGISHDEGSAFKWFLKAAEQNVPHAGCRVADSYAQGRGVRQDEGEAFKWYQREATNGCDRSQFHVGLWLEQHTNFADALPWYRQAATNGLNEAQTTLGERLSEGLACPPILPEAFLWFRMAAEQGNRVAGVSAKVLKAKLAPDQIDAAEKEVSRLLKARQKTGD
jgi:hypothetical protein